MLLTAERVGQASPRLCDWDYAMRCDAPGSHILHFAGACRIDISRPDRVKSQ
jgi:hypothetical protein